MNINKAHATDCFPVPDGRQLSATKVGLLEIGLEQARPFLLLHMLSIRVFKGFRASLA